MTSGENKPVLDVVCGILRKGNTVFAAKRPSGKPMAGLWEFPGGKLEPGETPEQALIRELREELGIQVKPGKPLPEIYHDYEKFTVHLIPLEASILQGELTCREHTEFCWIDIKQLEDFIFCDADKPLLSILGDKNE